MLNKVGKRLFEENTNYVEGPVFEYFKDGPMLIIAFQSPTAAEIKGIKNGKFEMGLYECGNILFIVIKVKSCGGWMDAPFSIRLYDGKRTFDWSEESTEGKGLALHLVLVDANDGILKAQRLIGTSNDFTKGLRSAILKQLEEPFSLAQYHNIVNETYKNLSSDDIANRATCKFIIR
jgi:hypothetical protein